MKRNNTRVCLGAIVGVHGIKGEVKVKSWTSWDADVASYGPVQNESGDRSFVLKVVGRSKELLRCKIKGVEDRNAAEALIGTALYVERDVLPSLAEEEYYLTDLIGLKVLDQTDEAVAEVSGVYNFGAGDILEIKLTNGKTEMLPFTKAYVPEVNLAERFVKVAATVMNFAPEDGAENEG